MALDGVFLHAVKNELEEELLQTKVDKVYQPEKDEIILSLRSVGKNYRLLLSAGANHPRIHLTESRRENPPSPPMFCMLLRKHLIGGRLTELYQPPFERVLKLTFDCYNELGDEIKKYLYIEIMGRYSNIILTDDSDKIIDSVKRVDISMSSQRQVLPGLAYSLPPAQDKLELNINNLDIIMELIIKEPQQRLDKAIQNTVKGLSPLTCRELSFLASKQTDKRISELSTDDLDRLLFHLKSLMNMYESGSFSPVLLYKPENKKPFEFSFMYITQYGRLALCQSTLSCSAILETFYDEKDKNESIKQRSADILKIITNAIERISKKINIQNAELKNCAEKEVFLLYGDLLTANLYRVKRGDSFAQVENFYDNECPVVKIPLDLQLSPGENAQKYYKKYRKLKNAETFLTEQIKKSKEELDYLETVFESLAKAENVREISEIRDELYNAGYIKKRNKGCKKKTQFQSLPMEFITDDGFIIYAGKNNLQNDALTLRTAKKHDIWFHTKSLPGSHTVLVTNGKNPSSEAMTQAAIIAATFSRGRDSKNVPVDYTEIRNVKKPQGAKPGFVIYEVYKTAYITPDLELCEKLRKN